MRTGFCFLLGQGFVTGEFADKVLESYFSYGWWSLLVAWGTLEVGGFFLVWRYKAKPDEYPEFQERLQRLAEEAGVRPPTLIVLRTMGARILNAAATQSILSGPKVIVMGDIVETLTDPEETYVTAHELSHIKHLDIVAGVFIGAGNSAISIQKWAILTSAVYELFTSAGARSSTWRRRGSSCPSRTRSTSCWRRRSPDRASTWPMSAR